MTLVAAIDPSLRQFLIGLRIGRAGHSRDRVDPPRRAKTRASIPALNNYDGRKSAGRQRDLSSGFLSPQVLQVANRVDPGSLLLFPK